LKSKKNILLFEPWHFGDLVIASGIARELKASGYNVSIAYNYKWESWVKHCDYFTVAYPVNIPWVARNFKEKYNLKKYGLNFWRNGIQLSKSLRVDFVVDMRGDIRNIFYLRFFFPFKKLIKLPNEKVVNVYHKKNFLFEKLNIVNLLPEKDAISFAIKSIIPNIVLFAGATDYNRSLPRAKLHEMFHMLANMNVACTLILEPSADVNSWKKFFEQLGRNKFDFIQADLFTVATCIQKADIVVSTDSGWLHIGHYYKKKLIGLFGFDTTNSWAPPGAIILLPDKMYDASLRYKKEYHNIQPLQELNMDNFKKALLSLLEE